MRKHTIFKKLGAAAAMSVAVALALAACGGSASSASSTAAETLTGTGKGFGGDITATLTVSDGVITDCALDGPNETADVGGAALEELAKQVVSANGPEIDGVTGATLTSNGVREAVSAAMGIETEEPASSAASSEAAASSAEPVSVEGGVQIGMAYGAAHGTDCFTEAVAVVKDDVILAAYIDEFQFTDASSDVTGVPNSDAGFGEGYAEGKVLISKRQNAEYYSGLMTSYAGATVTIDGNFDAIQSYVVGKTISELETVAASDNAVDAVSGATLADTAGYLSVIADAAKAAQQNTAVEFTGSSDDLSLKVVYATPHGEDGFATAAAVTSGDTIVLSYIDELQFTDASADVTGVPNSDAGVGEGCAEGKVLFSKRVNTDYYSGLMTSYAGATVTIDGNYDAIQNHVDGMSIADAKALSESDNAVDAVSGATLADTAGYIAAIVEAAQS